MFPHFFLMCVSISWALWNNVSSSIWLPQFPLSDFLHLSRTDCYFMDLPLKHIRYYQARFLFKWSCHNRYTECCDQSEFYVSGISYNYYKNSLLYVTSNLPLQPYCFSSLLPIHYFVKSKYLLTTPTLSFLCSFILFCY